MRRDWLTAVTVGIVLAGNLVAPPPAFASTPQASNPAAAPGAMAEAFDAYMKAAVETGHFSGTVLVARNGVPLFQGNYGLASIELNVPIRDDTVYDVQSITKPFTALLIMMLQEEGKLSVTDRACDYLADCPEAWRPITIEHLLTHTSGIEGYSRLDDWDETLDSRTYSRAGAASLVRNRPLRFAPGEGWRYSNSGYQLLAQIVERVSGKTLPEMYRERIFSPLGMNHSGFSNSRLVVPNQATGYYSLGSIFIRAAPESVTSNFGNGGIVSTAGDLLMWDQALYSNRLISRASYEQMIAHTKNDYGYGWEIRNWSRRRQIGHAGSGGGYSTQIARFIDDGLTVVVLSNSDAASGGGTAQALAAIYFGEDHRTPALSSEAMLLDAIIANGVDAGIQRYRDMKAAQPSAEAFQNDELLVSVGYELHGVPSMDEARRIFEFALQEFPRSAYSYDGLADIAAAEGDQDAAIRHFETSLAFDPTNEYAVKGLERVRAARPE